MPSALNIRYAISIIMFPVLSFWICSVRYIRSMRLTLSILFSLCVSSLFAQELNCVASFDAIYARWEKITNMRYHSHKTERQGNETDDAHFDFTIQRKPFKVAGRMQEKGHWILYDPAKSSNEALYISNGFPYTNLTLDVNGKVFRGMNHYTISDAGCEFVFEIIRREYERIPENFTCSVVERDGRKEWLIRAETENFTFVPYTGKSGETVLDVAHNNSVSAYLILERNEAVSSYTDDCSGVQLMIPSHYGKIVEIYFDANHLMPTRIQLFDEKGRFERYDYCDYRFNLDLDEDFFTEDYLDDLD